MKRKTKFAIAGVVVIVVGYALYKYLKPTEAVVEGEGETPSDDGSSGGLLSSLTDVFGLTNGDEAEMTDTPTPDLTEYPDYEDTPGAGPATPPPTVIPPSSSSECVATNLDHLEPLPASLNCTAGYTNHANCQTTHVCIPGFSTTPTNACGAGVARWQVLLNEHYKSAGNGQCIPTADLGRATPQTNEKTQELIASGALQAT